MSSSTRKSAKSCISKELEVQERRGLHRRGLGAAASGVLLDCVAASAAFDWVVGGWVAASCVVCHVTREEAVPERAALLISSGDGRARML